MHPVVGWQNFSASMVIDRKCIFVGPSLRNGQVPAGIDVLPPARLGSVFAAVERGYRTVGLIDGLFGCIPSVWHKEILYALSKGCVVLGGSSIGALRAAELWPYGMIGVGRVFCMFKYGVLTDDDEVALMHLPRCAGYEPTTYPMVNLRATLWRLRRARVISTCAAEFLCRNFKEIHFTRRDTAAVNQIVNTLAGGGDRSISPECFWSQYFDMKAADARSVIRAVDRRSFSRSANAHFSFVSTVHWRDQFVRRVHELSEWDD